MTLEPEPTVNRIDPQTIPPESTVCHFDELGDEAKDGLIALLDDRHIDSIDIEGLTACDVVKYVDYYDVDVPEARLAD